MELVGCPEMSVRKNYYMLRNNLEERRPHVHHGVKSEITHKNWCSPFFHSFLILLHFIPDFRNVERTSYRTVQGIFPSVRKEQPEPSTDTSERIKR